MTTNRRFGEGLFEEDVLVERALGALQVTPGSVAAAEGLDPRRLYTLKTARGNGEAAARLARALERRSAELRALADELTAAAHEG